MRALPGDYAISSKKDRNREAGNRLTFFFIAKHWMPCTRESYAVDSVRKLFLYEVGIALLLMQIKRLAAAHDQFKLYKRAADQVRTDKVQGIRKHVVTA